MGKSVRNIVHIDETKCNGCGQCATACAEGAIAIIDGKARLVAEHYCDGLGACLGECPQGAITIEQRPADEYDEVATQEHLRRLGRDPAAAHTTGGAHAACPSHGPAHAGCPSAQARSLSPARPAASTGQASALGNWPVQLALVPPTAPYLQGADLLLCADCVPFAYPDFHAGLLPGKVALVGCPKLDDGSFYVDKLAAILRQAKPASLTLAIMEVPCCSGLVRIAQAAQAVAGTDVPVEVVTIGIRGEMLA